MKILLADDHPLFLEGLQYLLETHGIRVGGIAKDGLEAMEKARLLQPDIILMDIKMPGLNGLEALKRIKTEMPHVKVVMLTASEDDEDLSDALKNGASGYLLKSTQAKELLEVLSESVPSIPSQDNQQRQTENIPEKPCSLKGAEPSKDMRLTDRQLEILKLIANGATYKEAGELLGLAERTLKYHVNRIKELLQMDTTAQVIAYAARMGLLKDK